MVTEVLRAGFFMASEANVTRSRDQVTVLSGQNLKAGAVIGKVAVGAGSSAAYAGNTGNGAMGAITAGAGAKPGLYKLTIIEPGANAGKFTVEDPDGVTVGIGTVAVAFSGGGLSFTLADGATDFIAGDGFDITVAAGSGKVVEFDPSGTDGRQIAAGVMYDACDASAADAQGVAVTRDAEVAWVDLLWGAGVDANEKAVARTQLAAHGIIGR